jgi:hypothetical protein
VLWQVTLHFAEWISSRKNVFFESGVLSSESNVLELGCGISGLLALVFAPKIKAYIATDQEYVLKGLRNNISQNQTAQQAPIGRKAGKSSKSTAKSENIILRSLDWESDDIPSLCKELGIDHKTDRIHMIVACDCIYNESLVDPFVATCAELCAAASSETPSVCVVAQQLRSPEIFESWLCAFHRRFQVWRLSDKVLSSDLAAGSGFAIHVGILR